MAEEVPDLELTKEKKKKKKKPAVSRPLDPWLVPLPPLSSPRRPINNPVPQPAAGGDAGGDVPAAGGDTMDADEAEFAAALQKRKPKKKKESQLEAVMETGAEGGAGYQYKELLDMLYTKLKEQNPEFQVKTKITLKPPQVEKCGAKKTSFVNFAEICNSLKRPEEHLFQFIQAELSTGGSVDSNSCLILKGKFQPKHIEGLLRKYINEYVICAMCRSLETSLSKDQHSRLYQLQCMKCNAGRTVSAIQSSYQAAKKKR